MKYDFERIIDRRKTGSSKWLVEEDCLPMWIADMDFETAPCVREAIEKRIAISAYGYTEPEDDWYQAYLSFWKRRYGFEMKKENLFFSTGVVPTISSTVRALTSVGDQVVVFTPVYNIFFNSIVNNHRLPLEVPLLQNETGWYLDFKGIEKAFSDEKTTLCIFCNPHNPVGRIWTEDELIRLGELARKYHVTILSDEIHCQITRTGKTYLPFMSLNETNRDITVMAISATKAFNIAGIQTSAVYIENPELYRKVNRQLNTDECAEPNILACVSAIAALNDGEDWLDQLRLYLDKNMDYAISYIREELPLLKVREEDATYLLWIDVSSYHKDGKEFASELREKTGLYLSAGNVYGKGGEHFVRMNLACPFALVQDGLLRLKEFILSL